MPTTKQRLVIGKLIENPRVSLYSAMVQSGYAPSTAVNPGKNLIKQPGFQDLLEEYLPDSMLLGALREDINEKKGNRKGELELAFRVKGRLVAQEPGSTGDTYNNFIGNNTINPNAPGAKEIVEATLDILMERTKRKVVT